MGRAYRKEELDKFELEVRRLNTLGWGNTKIAKEIGVTATSVQKWVKEWGLPRNHTIPLQVVWPEKEQIEEFFSCVLIPDDLDTCNLWIGKINNDGYGQFYRAKKVTGSQGRAHRFAWALHTGEKCQTGTHILHSCDYPRCVNFRHLREGTQTDNNKDCFERGRVSRGSGKPRVTKLKESEVLQIRELMNRGYPLRSIAQAFEVADTTVHAIKTGQSWSWLKR